MELLCRFLYGSFFGLCSVLLVKICRGSTGLAVCSFYELCMVQDKRYTHDTHKAPGQALYPRHSNRDGGKNSSPGLRN